ncbi:MAG: hypothetical protein ACRDSR_07960 [Pseudonocardiaceae bacterium]
MSSTGDDEVDAADLLATLLVCPAEMLDVSLDQFRTLAVVHTTGTAQRAARVLGREQSSVQKQLDNLNKAAARLVGEASTSGPATCGANSTRRRSTWSAAVSPPNPAGRPRWTTISWNGTANGLLCSPTSPLANCPTPRSPRPDCPDCPCSRRPPGCWPSSSAAGTGRTTAAGST